MVSIKDQIIRALQAITEAKEVNLEFPENESFGDYSSNVAMILAKKKGSFLENIEWILKNVTEENWEKEYNQHAGLPVGRLSEEVRKATESPSNLVFLKPRIYAKTQGWWRNFPGHNELSFEFLLLPLTIANPLEVFEDPKDLSRFFMTFKYQHRGVLVVEINENKRGNQIVTMFLVGEKRLRKRKVLYLANKKNSILGRRRISSLLAPRRSGVAGARLSGLQESHTFYSRLEEESQGEFSLEYELKQNPNDLAQEIVNKIKVAGLPAEAEAKAGFINFWLKKDVLINNLIQIDTEKEKYGSSSSGLPAQAGKTVVIDYSSPNIAKPFGIGHLRSTIIGQALYNLYKFRGYEVIGDNHLGDWGTQFGKLLYMIKAKDVASFDIARLEELYVEFHRLVENDPSLGGKAREWFKKLEDGDFEAKSIWKKCVDISLEEFERVYDLLGVKIDFAYGESYYGSEMKDLLSNPSIVKHASEGEDGAKIIDLSKEGINIPLMLLKKDEGTTYATRDLATIAFRVRKWNPDIIIYEVGAEQSFYFKQIFAAARLLGLVHKKVKLVHTAHGLYLAPDGKKFATREGKTIKLEEVLAEAVKKAKNLGNKDEKVAKMVGIGAIKYFDLMHSVQSNVVFDWEKMMNLEGNSGPYLQYTVARINSVLQKAPGTRKLVTSNYSLMPEEYAVLRFLVRFPEVISDAAKSYSPNILCNYLYDLAQKFNTFYNKYRILSPTVRGVASQHLGGGRMDSSEVENFRVALTGGVGQVLKTGLKLLGIEAPERM